MTACTSLWTRILPVALLSLPLLPLLNTFPSLPLLTGKSPPPETLSPGLFHGPTMTTAVPEFTGASDLERLHEFARRGMSGDAQELMASNNALVTTKGNLGNQTLHWACQAGHFDVVKGVIGAVSGTLGGAVWVGTERPYPCQNPYQTQLVGGLLAPTTSYPQLSS